MTQEENMECDESLFPPYSDLEEALAANDFRSLCGLIIGASLNWEDLAMAEAMCERFSHHPNEEVRGNAILGLGHLARRFRQLSPNLAQIIRAGLNEVSHHVLSQSWAAASDVRHFLGWTVTATECNTVPEGIIPVDAPDDREDDEEDDDDAATTR